jgi:Fur family ferric uptake transcriptional regulator
MDLLTRLRARPDFRLTSQRRVVAEVLRGEHVHVTAEAVHDLAREHLPEISLATVYNTLNELVAIGEVLELSVGEGAKRYDPNVETPHHHLRCVRCNELRDVRREGTRHLALPDGEDHGYQLIDVDVVFQGVCPRCQATS